MDNLKHENAHSAFTAIDVDGDENSLDSGGGVPRTSYPATTRVLFPVQTSSMVGMSLPPERPLSRPSPLSGYTTASEDSAFEYDPQKSFQENLASLRGVILHIYPSLDVRASVEDDVTTSSSSSSDDDL
jgi:hypothetical protein